MYRQLPLVLTFLCLLLIIVVLRRDHRSFTHRLFAFFLFSLGLWGFLIFGMRNSPDLSSAIPWDKGVMVAATLSGLFFYHFTLSYTGIKRARWILYLFYGWAFIIAILSPTDTWVAGMQQKSYGYAPVLGRGFILLFLMAYLQVILGMANMIKARKRSREYEERNRYVYLVIGISLSLVGAVFDVLPTLGFPLYPGGMIGNIAFCLMATVAMLRYHLLDINIILRRGTYYLLMSAIVALPYVGIIVLFYLLFNQSLPLWATIIFLIAMAFSLQPIWQKIQGLVDRWFYRGRYDFLIELEEFTKQIHNISNLKQIASPLVKLLSRALQASSIHLLLPTGPKELSVVSAIGPDSSEFSVSRLSPLVTWLQTHNDTLYRFEIDINQQLQCLTDKERAQLQKIRAEMFFPLKTKSNELVGILIVGEKLSGQTYSKEDEQLVLTIASRMAVEMDNALLYDREKSMREELQRQNEQKTEFLHAVAHELKTPLTAIISSSELLNSELSEPPASPKQRLIDNITHSAWSMDRRITELLDFARMQIGAFRVEVSDIEVGTTIEEVASVLQVLFKNKGQTFKLEVTKPLSQVRADKDKLEQVLVNLLSNANKFSPSGSNIFLRAREDKASIIVEVEDSAQAISDKERKRIFEPYYRGEDPDKRQRVPGLGLGLAISKRLVEMQQGEMWLQAHEGKGNIFAFSLPVSRKQDGETAKSPS